MKKLATLLLSAVLCLTASQGFAQGAPSPQAPMTPQAPVASIDWRTSIPDVADRALASSKPILIFFTGTGWCTWCTKLEQEVFHQPEFAQMVGNRFIFMKADFPDYSDEALARSPYKGIMDRYRVDSFPTVVVVDKNGNHLFSMSYMPGGARNFANQLLQRLNAVYQAGGPR
jgi:thioredoxin-related protein